MMAEESDRPGGPPRPPEGPGERRPPGRSEGDLLAERRALRATESGEAALLRRAEAAEATVHTLERHVTSLQQRLDEADGERLRLSELLEAERTVAVEREHELRRVKQREYAEQQLRVEAEDRLIGVDRESRADLEQLASRLGASERDALALSGRLEDVQRQLAEAEHAAASERAERRRSEEEMQARLGALDARTDRVARELQTEREARERSERLLEVMRTGHRRMELLVAEIKQIVARLTAALGSREALPEPSSPTPGPVVPRAPLPPAEQDARAEEEQRGRAAASTAAVAELRGEEMAAALASAVDRLRARAEAAPPPAPDAPQAPAADAPQAPAAEASQAPADGLPERVPHKHSMTLIGRWRFRRKQRRGL
jgi:chromosome segregation ATPase